MKEILFRGRRINNGEWVYGSLLIQSGEWVSKTTQAPDEYCIVGKQGEHYLVDSDTVGQYTNYKDKNSERIFEGDILVGHLGYRYVVNYYPEHAAFMSRCIETNRVDYLCNFRQADISVIGNIHDNPII